LAYYGNSLKVRRGGVGTHFVLHKYFYERNPSWKAIRQEEQEAEQVKIEKNEANDDEDQNSLEEHKLLNFTPIDARHLSSYPLISRRVIRLLQASKNCIHASKDMLIKLVRTRIKYKIYEIKLQLPPGFFQSYKN